MLAKSNSYTDTSSLDAPIRFELTKTGPAAAGTTSRCTYWDEQRLTWDTEGCTLVETSGSTVTCVCFSVLLKLLTLLPGMHTLDVLCHSYNPQWCFTQWCSPLRSTTHHLHRAGHLNTLLVCDLPHISHLQGQLVL